MLNGVVDISHHNTITNWKSVKNAGIVAVIHKATEGRNYRDKEYHRRKEKAVDSGFLWGSYHFSSGASPLIQVENYLEYARPSGNELICLDYEPSSSGQNMTYGQAVSFVELIFQELGRYPVIYGGHLLRDVTSGVENSVLSKCPLWYARYADRPYGIPKLWPTWTLWQYTDGNVGNAGPQTVAGIGNCDRDFYNGDEAGLVAAWPFT